MNPDAFWTLIESAVAAHEDTEDRDQALATALSALPAEQVAGFRRLLDEADSRARTWLMWGAAHRILGWCSDDGFEDFRMWLLSLGRTGFARVVAEPDALAKLPQVLRLAGREPRDWAEKEWPAWEALDYVTGEDLPDTSVAAFHFGTGNDDASPQPRAERARAWLSQWRPADRSGNHDGV